ncbi:hypothetical protein BABAJAGA_00490 [Brevundimonas phage vB_BgoS-BabaJaga]|nr:hypothetical protein BABAJAGA_00490 [Brevundimonas phage vB_BgoS-BabaJaga]
MNSRERREYQAHGHELDSLDDGLEELPEISRAMQAKIDGNKAYGDGVKLEDGPKEFNAEWRQGWNDALHWKASAFQNYIKYRTLFDGNYRPQWAARSTFERFQETRKKKIDFLEGRYPDFPAAYTKYKEQRR